MMNHDDCVADELNHAANNFCKSLNNQWDVSNGDVS